MSIQAFAGKTAVITGAGAGFGAAISQKLAADGARVVLVDRRSDACERTADDIRKAGGQAEVVVGDVASAETHSRASEHAAAAYGRLDVWVNNAAMAQENKPFQEVSEEEFDRIFAVNVRSIFVAAKLIAPQLKKTKGVIINISSAVAIRPRPGLAVYNASKAAVNVLTKSLAQELAPDVRVNAVCPTLGETRLLETFTGVPDTPENRQRFLNVIPLGRLAKPSDVASAVTFLASGEAEFITGVTLEVDGGRCL